MGLFGWSYPAGCSGPPDDETPFCEVCGNSVDDDKCICPECPVCGEHGNPDCYVNHALIKSQKQIDAKKRNDEYWENRLQQEHEAETALDRIMIEDDGEYNLLEESPRENSEEFFGSYQFVD